MTTLLALYRRPEGGDAALAEFERRYAQEHLPLVAKQMKHLAIVRSLKTAEGDHRRGSFLMSTCWISRDRCKPSTRRPASAAATS